MGAESREQTDKNWGRGRRAKKTMDDASRKPGCAVPLSAGCIKGNPLPTSLDDGVKMICSNEHCPFKEQLIHSECFNALEDYLVKIIANIGSARGWTDSQRYANLWDKKGYTLIQKMCRCPCDLGLLKVDETALFNAQRINAGTPLTAPTKHKKAKGKNLPKLNLGRGPSVEPPTNLLFDIVIPKRGARCRPRSRSRSPSYVGTVYFRTGSVEHGSMSYAKCVGKRDSAASLKADRDRQFTRFPSAAPVPVKLDKFNVQRAATAKSRLVTGELSYARATAITALNSHNETPTEETLMMSREDSYSQLGINSSTIRSSVFISPCDDDVAIDQLSRRTSLCSDECPELSRLKEETSDEIFIDEVANFGASMREVLSPLPAVSVLSSVFDLYDGRDDEEECFLDEVGEQESSICYRLFDGSSFLLGERLIANFHLPGLI